MSVIARMAGGEVELQLVLPGLVPLNPPRESRPSTFLGPRFGIAALLRIDQRFGSPSSCGPVLATRRLHAPHFWCPFQGPCVRIHPGRVPRQCMFCRGARSGRVPTHECHDVGLCEQRHGGTRSVAPSAFDKRCFLRMTSIDSLAHLTGANLEATGQVKHSCLTLACALLWHLASLHVVYPAQRIRLLLTTRYPLYFYGVLFQTGVRSLLFF